MPFTLAHAAAALPFRRTRLIMSAVVIGCFAPDFEYFLGRHGSFGHTWTGMFVFDLPVSLAVLWLFHRYAKEPLAACLPRGGSQRLDLEPNHLQISSLSTFATIVLSALVGIATHLFWDAFTHPRYWLYDHWHFLRTKISLPLFGPRPWYGILQYASSAFGIAVILLWYIHWYRNTPPIHSKSEKLTTDRVVLACLFLTAVVFALIRASVSGIPHGVEGSQRFISEAAITGITILSFEILIYGMVRNVRRKTVKAA